MSPEPHGAHSADGSALSADLAGKRIGWVPFSREKRVPSARLRSLLPVEALRRVGVDASIVPREHAGAFDCVVFQKAYRPDHYEYAERLADQGVKLVFDLCDEHFYNPDGNPELAERAQRLRAMIDLVDVVSVSVPTLADVVQRPRVHVVDDALEETRVSAPARWLARRRRSNGRLRLVWFGHAGTEHTPAGIPHLGALVPELERLDRVRPIQLTVISDSEAMFDRHVKGASFPTRYVRWTERGFGRRVVGSDVCVLPIQVNPYTVQKTNNRVRTALLLGVPVVTTEIPSYREFAEWIAFDDWTANILRIADDPERARADVDAACAYIRATYTPERLVSQWGAVLRDALTSSS